MFVPPKNETKKYLPADPGHVLSTEIDSADFENENLLQKQEETRQENHIFCKKNLPLDLETDATIKQDK